MNDEWMVRSAHPTLAGRIAGSPSGLRGPVLLSPLYTSVPCRTPSHRHRPQNNSLATFASNWLRWRIPHAQRQWRLT